jgi:hypothetical protein
MSGCRQYPGAAVNIVGANKFIIPLWCAYLVGAGFEEMNHTVSGCRSFCTHSFKVVEAAFDCLSHGATPFLNYSSIKSDGIFEICKAANNMLDASLVMNLRVAKRKELQESAVAELHSSQHKVEQMTKNELIARLVHSRIKSKSYIGMSAVFRLVVDDENPFEVLVRPGRFSKSLIRLTFAVTKHAINFRRG